jgi:hypothetical protein
VPIIKTQGCSQNLASTSNYTAAADACFQCVCYEKSERVEFGALCGSNEGVRFSSSDQSLLFWSKSYADTADGLMRAC